MPFIIIVATILVVLTIVIGSSIASRPAHNDGTTSGGGVSVEALNQEAQQLMQEASALAERYYYQEALDLLGTFSGDISQFSELRNLYNRTFDLLQER